MKSSIFKVIFYIISLFYFCSCVTPVSVPNISKEQNIKEDNQLKILSWNIKMLPAPYGWLLKPYQRSDNIIQSLNETIEYDIIFFQEAFLGSARSKIYKTIQNTYPYQIEPNNRNAFYKSNSGLWVVSRLPIILIDEISFTQLRESDILASKGAKLYSVCKNQQKFHLINTHMQSDYGKEYSDIRSSQYSEIYKNLILPNEKSKVTLILCGDLNISQPVKLKEMLKKLKLNNGPLFGKLQHSTLGNNKHLLDYILVREDHLKFKSIKRRIIDFSNKIKEKDFNPSDHYPVEAIFRW